MIKDLSEIATSTRAPLANPIMRDINYTSTRTIQDRGQVKLPQGLLVVSADGHWEINEDIFYERFPVGLRELAPRVWWDEFWRIGQKGGIQAMPENETITKINVLTTRVDGLWDIQARRKDLDAEGVAKEIVFPQTLLSFIRHPNLEVQECMYRIYNDYAAERSKLGLYGVGICSNWWDPAKARSALEQVAKLGLKTFMIPVAPGKYPNGKTISWADPEMDGFWATASELGLPVNFHVGENPSFEGPGGFALNVLLLVSPFRKPLGQLIFGGVLDRHPKLKIVFTEAGISWVAPALQDAEAIYDSFGDLVNPRPRRRPSEYWHENCYATFQTDVVGLSQLKYIGADRVMWASDYPHSEGTYGYTWTAMQAVMDATTEADARLILGDTATKVYGL